jgi:hypothetical protein
MLAREKWQVKTIQVLDRVFEERIRQVAQYGHNEALEDGTGPSSQWLRPVSNIPARTIQESFRREYEEHELITGFPTWMHLIREEIAEAFEAGDEETLVEELLQVAALCVSWVEKKVPERSPALRQP